MGDLEAKRARHWVEMGLRVVGSGLDFRVSTRERGLRVCAGVLLVGRIVLVPSPILLAMCLSSSRTHDMCVPSLILLASFS